MKSDRCIRILFLVLVATVLTVACHSSHGENDSRSAGNVRVVLSASAPITLATSLRADAVSVPGSTTSASGTTILQEDGEDDDSGEILSRLDQVNVTFSDILARNLDGDLIEMTIDLPHTVDLISLINGKEVTLPDGSLPPGMYDQIVVVIKSVEFVFIDGTHVLLTPPGGGWTRIIPVEPFEVVEGQTTTIELRFNPTRAFDDLDGQFHFSPDFDCHRRDD